MKRPEKLNKDKWEDYGASDWGEYVDGYNYASDLWEAREKWVVERLEKIDVSIWQTELDNLIKEICE
jgi:hypothetical protein